MSYGLKYVLEFDNELGQRVTINFKKNGYASSSSELTGGANVLNISYPDSTEKLGERVVLSMEALIDIRIETTDTVTYEDFIFDSEDEWYIEILLDYTYYLFTGWLVPEEGRVQLKDKPYNITLRATDGLGLLKSKALSDTALVNFDARNFLLEYIVGCTYKANPNINVQIQSNIYETSMLDRSDGTQYDLFAQAMVDAKTFQTDNCKVFENCYAALERMLSGWGMVFQYNGKWQVIRFAEYQPTHTWYYTEYSPTGTVVTSGLSKIGAASIGKDKIIHAINADQYLSTRFNDKQIKLTFNYRLPDEIVFNSKINCPGDFLSPLSTSTSLAYELNGWGSYQGDMPLGTSTEERADNTVTPYSRFDYDAFGNEIERYYCVPVDTATDNTGLRNFIRNNDDIFVTEGDKIVISLQSRSKLDRGNTPGAVGILNVSIYDGGNPNSSASYWQLHDNGDGTGSWNNAGGIEQTWARVTIDKDLTEWESFELTADPIPVDGKLYIRLGTGGFSEAGHELQFKDIRLDYTPILNGIYRPVHGEYNLIERAVLGKNDDREILISDTVHKGLRGSIFQDDGESSTNPTWYRQGVSEEMRFSKLAALGLYNLSWRKMQKIEGTFKGFTFYHDEDASDIRLLGMLARYEFSDIGDGRQFVIIPPFTINVKRGWFSALFLEVYKDSNDGSQTGTYSFNYNY